MEPDPRFWAGKSVCVTGGTGFLGYHLVTQLLELGADVRVLALRPSGNHPIEAAAVRAFYGDVRDAALVRRAVTSCAVVFHAAGPVVVCGGTLACLHDVHVEGTRNVLEAADTARVVHTSSLVAIAAARPGVPVTEETPFNLDGVKLPYVHAKRAAEALALEAAGRGRDVVVVNPGYLVGPEDHEHSVMGRFCGRFWKGRLPLVPPGGFNLVDVRDVAAGHLLAAEHGRPGRRYLLGGEDHTFPSLMRLLAEVAGLRPRALPRFRWWGLAVLAVLAEGRSWLLGKEPFPSFGHVRLNRHHWFCRSDRAARELGYAPRPLVQALADTYRWYQGRGALPLRGLSRWWMRPAA